MKERKTKRDFLKKSTLAATGLTVARAKHHSIIAPIMDTGEPLKI